MTVYSILSVGLTFIKGQEISQINFCVELIIVMGMLFYSVINIRQSIKMMKNVFPNECFMAWHIINFLMLTVVTILDRVTDIIAYN